MKYKGKTLTGSEFLNLIYHFPYPEKNAWQRLKIPFKEQIFPYIGPGIISFGTLIPFVFLAETFGPRINGTRPIIPKKGIDEKVFESFCKQNLSALNGSALKVHYIRLLLEQLGLIFSNLDPREDITPLNDPFIFTLTGKRMIKNPVKGFATQSTLNNHTFAKTLVEYDYFLAFK